MGFRVMIQAPTLSFLNSKQVSPLGVCGEVSFICDPIQHKGHLVDQVHAEIMNKIVCKIWRKYKEIQTCTFKGITSIFTNFVSLEILLNIQLDNAKISICSKLDKMYLLLYWVTYAEDELSSVDKYTYLNYPWHLWVPISKGSSLRHQWSVGDNKSSSWCRMQ